jgi:beta-glucanase (GH16 family)
MNGYNQTRSFIKKTINNNTNGSNQMTELSTSFQNNQDTPPTATAATASDNAKSFINSMKAKSSASFKRTFKRQRNNNNDHIETANEITNTNEPNMLNVNESERVVPGKSMIIALSSASSSSTSTSESTSTSTSTSTGSSSSPKVNNNNIRKKNDQLNISE